MTINLIKQLRLDRGLRQLDVARQLGVSEAMISKIETGRMQPNHLLIERLACCLKTTSEDILRSFYQGPTFRR